MADMDHKACLKKLRCYQEADRDARRLARESQSFLFDEGGHWEEKAVKLFEDRPRYQFDHTYPIWNAITHDLTEMDFAIQVIEAGNGASAEIAKTYDGMLRSIQNMSSFDLIKAELVSNLVCAGSDALMVRNDWGDVDAFDQDLLIEHIQDSLNRVWLGPAQKIDGSDREDGFLITRISLNEYGRDYPKGTKRGVDAPDDWVDELAKDQEDIAVADYYYIKRESTKLLLLSNDKVVREDEYNKSKDDLAAKGITVVRQRTRDIPVCYVRRMDGAEWLGDPQKTPFAYIPIVQPMANHKVVQGRVKYFGVVEKLKDAQRVYDYAGSREIADGALAPVGKIAMTPEQAAGFEEQNSQLNKENNPILLYNADTAAPPPFQLAGAQPNPGLQQTRLNASQDVITISGQYEPARGEGLGPDTSGKAYEILQQKSNLSSGPYVVAMRRAVRMLGKIIIDAIPKVYDTRSRQVRLMNEDGSSKFTSINHEDYAEDGTTQIMRDLSQGHYDVVVTNGKGFASRKAEGVRAMLEMASVVPGIVDAGADVIAKSLDAPYVEQVAERLRKQMIEQGRIPENQLTDDERAKIMQEMEQAQNQPPSPADQVIMAETQRIVMETQKLHQQMQIDMMEQIRKMEESTAKIAQMMAATQKSQAEAVLSLTTAEQQNLPGDAASESAEKIAKSIK